MPIRKGLDRHSLWAQRRDGARDNQPSSRESLDDLEVKRESESRYHKRPSKIFHDLIRWELHQIREYLADLRFQHREARSHGCYDPLAIETYAREHAALSDVERGDVLKDPKIRPAGYVHPALRMPLVIVTKKEERDV